MAEWFSNLFKTDERFITHRYYSSRLALVVGILMMAAWFNYELLVNDMMRIYLLVFMVAMAVTKLAAMLYFRFFH